MALLSGFNQIEPSTQTFSDWLNKTNEMILMFRGDTTGAQTAVVTANNLPGGSMTYGNATLFGQFAANAMVVFNEGGDPSSNAYANGNYGGLRGGTFDYGVNNFVSDTLYVTTNTTFTDESTEVFVDSTYGLIVTNFIEARHDVLFVGNTGSNTDAQLHWQDNNNTLNWNEEVRAIFGGNTGTDGINPTDPAELSLYGGTDQYEMFYLDGRMYTNTDIQDTRASANLNLITDTFEMRSETGNEMIMTANVNNGVELYWNDQLKLSTNAYGVVVHGDAYVRDDVIINDNQKLLFGTTYPDSQNVETIGVHNLQMYTDGTDGFIVSGETGGGLKIRVDTDFHVQYEDGSNNYITANNDGYSEVVLYASGERRLETIDGALNPDSVDGVEIYGEANTTTLRVLDDANFDSSGSLNSNSVHWDASLDIWNYRDLVRVTLGDSDDWEMFYDGVGGRAYSNTDNMDIRARSDMNMITDIFELKSETGAELYLTANVNNGVELYWDNNKKFSTNTHGVEVYGQVIADNGFVTYNNQPIEMGGANYAAAHNFTIVTDGTDTTITETTNDLFIRVEDNFRVTDDTGATSLIVANTSGEVTLYHNNIEKLQTNTTGIEVYGEANTETLRVQDNAYFDGSAGLDSNEMVWNSSNNALQFKNDTKAEFGETSTVEIYHDGSDGYIKEQGGGNFIIQGNNMVLQTTTGENYLQGLADADVTLYYNGNAKLNTTNIGVNVTGNVVSDGLVVDGNSDLNGNIDLGLDTTSVISYTGRVNTDIDPSSNNSYDLGSDALRWNNLWIGGTATIDALIAEGNAIFEDSVSIQDSLTVTNDLTVSTGTITGDGVNITNINADNIASGTLNDARLPDEISSNVSGTSAQSNTIEVDTTVNTDTNFPIAFVATAGTYRQVHADSTFVYNTQDDELSVRNLVVTEAATLPAGVSFSNTTTFENIIVTDTANLNTLSVTSLEANGVAFTGTGDEVTTPSTDTVIDSFDLGQTQGFKYLVYGENLSNANSGYMVEITCIVTDNGDVFFTRYGEVDNDIGTITLTPVVNTVPSTDQVQLIAQTSETGTHEFKVLKIETRTNV
jgi:hypothetical protein